jgi:hypothetical protein
MDQINERNKRNLANKMDAPKAIKVTELQMDVPQITQQKIKRIKYGVPIIPSRSLAEDTDSSLKMALIRGGVQSSRVEGLFVAPAATKPAS